MDGQLSITAGASESARLLREQSCRWLEVWLTGALEGIWISVTERSPHSPTVVLTSGKQTKH